MNQQEKFEYVTSLGAISGFLLSTIRSQIGLQQNEIAKIFGIAQATYGNMERGEAAINVDFIFMLCSIAKIEFTEYFRMIDLITAELDNLDFQMNNVPVEISLIPSTDFQKMTTDNVANKNLAYLKGDSPNILRGQDFHLFLSKETFIDIKRLTSVEYDKAEIKLMLNTTVEDLDSTTNNVLNPKRSESLWTAVTVNVSTDAVASLLEIHNPLLAGYGTVGFSLFKAHKVAKEFKKTNRS